MRRATRLLAVVGLLTVLVQGAPPAAAHERLCTGTGGVAVTGNDPLFWPGGHYTPTTNVQIVLNVGPLCPLAGVAVSGFMSGYCGMAYGVGTAEGHQTMYLWTGTQLVLTGFVAGTLVLRDMPLNHLSNCVNGGYDFPGAGTLWMNHLVGPVVFQRPIFGPLPCFFSC